MPNWCNNTITLTGPKAKITKIYEKAKEDNAFLQQLHPMPTELEDTTKGSNGDADNWYDWRVENWAQSGMSTWTV